MAALPTQPTLGGKPTYNSPYAGTTTNAGSSPIMPEFNSIFDPATMSLAPQLGGLLNGVQYNQAPLQEIEQNAKSTSDSPWASLQKQLSRSQNAQSASKAANQTAGQTAQAQGNLALSGGLSSGANERTQEAGEKAGIDAQQNIQNQGNNQQMQIGLQDAANKQQQMMALPGMETQAYQANLEPLQMYGQAAAQDVAHQMANQQAQNQFNMGAYGNQAAMYGAGQTANAQQQTAQDTSGLFGGGGFLGTGSWLCTERNYIVKLTKDEKVNLAKLLRFAKKVDHDFTKWYLGHGTELVQKIKEQDSEWAKTTNMEFISKVLSLLEDGKFEETFYFYRKHVYALCHKYWADCGGVIADHPERKEWAA